VSARRSGQAPLSRDRIVSAAMAIVDSEGLPGLSMRRLGAELGVDASSIYYHVPNKSALYDLVIDAVMRELDLSADDTSAPAEERLMLGVQAFRDVLLSHPRALPLLASRSFTTPDSLRPAEHLLGILLEAGLDATSAMAAINAIAYFSIGATLAYSHHLLDTEFHDGVDEAAYAKLPANEFPHITSMPLSEDYDFNREFDLGARALVHGLLQYGSART
jgi:TetR/AcrR family transcriptional regulator, tetracycline repressor protein